MECNPVLDYSKENAWKSWAAAHTPAASEPGYRIGYSSRVRATYAMAMSENLRWHAIDILVLRGSSG